MKYYVDADIVLYKRIQENDKVLEALVVPPSLLKYAFHQAMMPWVTMTPCECTIAWKDYIIGKVCGCGSVCQKVSKMQTTISETTKLCTASQWNTINTNALHFNGFNRPLQTFTQGTPVCTYYHWIASKLCLVYIFGKVSTKWLMFKRTWPEIG